MATKLKQLSGYLRLGDIVRIQDAENVNHIAVCVESDGHPEYPFCCMVVSDTKQERGEYWPERYERLGNVNEVVGMLALMGRPRINTQDIIDLLPDPTWMTMEESRRYRAGSKLQLDAIPYPTLGSLRREDAKSGSSTKRASDFRKALEKHVKKLVTKKAPAAKKAVGKRRPRLHNRLGFRVSQADVQYAIGGVRGKASLRSIANFIAKAHPDADMRRLRHNCASLLINMHKAGSLKRSGTKGSYSYTLD